MIGVDKAGKSTQYFFQVLVLHCFEVSMPTASHTQRGLSNYPTSLAVQRKESNYGSWQVFEVLDSFCSAS